MEDARVEDDRKGAGGRAREVVIGLTTFRPGVVAWITARFFDVDPMKRLEQSPDY